ncbi:MAG: metalloregulator ArsR/SmtB family transcription factor [Prochloraceae cyanobacterium]|nr:metalloregulator ArsR/SmtB family transcription factor [Prochloraceae cyanobacterium]
MNIRNNEDMKTAKAQQTAEEVCELMKVLSSKNRFLILCALANGEKSVGEIAETIGIREATTSQHLALLRKDKIVQPRRENQMIYYSIARSDVRKLMDFLYENYCKKNLNSEEEEKKIETKQT